LEKEKPIFIQFLQAVTCHGKRPKGILTPPEKKPASNYFRFSWISGIIFLSRKTAAEKNYWLFSRSSRFKFKVHHLG
jgi:hypothetical protein